MISAMLFTAQILSNASKATVIEQNSTVKLYSKGELICLVYNGIKIGTQFVVYEKDGKEYHITDADTLIFAVGYAPNKVENTEERVHFIGDCDKVGTLKDAIAAGHKLAEELLSKKGCVSKC